MTDKLSDARAHIRKLEDRIAELSDENDALRDRDKRVCCLCSEKTMRISFRLGYGSVYDGEHVCWNCASKFDVIIASGPPKEMKLSDTPCSP